MPGAFVFLTTLKVKSIQQSLADVLKHVGINLHADFVQQSYPSLPATTSALFPLSEVTTIIYMT